MTAAERHEQAMRELRYEQIPERPPVPYSVALTAAQQGYRRIALERDVKAYDAAHGPQDCPTAP